MPEKINENIFKDETESLEKKSSADFEFSKNSEIEQLTGDINRLANAIDHDGVVKNDDLQKIEEKISELKIEINGEQFTMEELKKIPDVKENIKIWKEIKEGNVKNAYKLTYITPNIAERLSKFQGILDLGGLTYISDATAEHLSKHQVAIYLYNLTTISDLTAEYFSKHQGYLNLEGLTTISEVSAEYLSKHKNLFVNDEIRVILKKYKQ